MRSFLRNRWPIIWGISGPNLTQEEETFFRDYPPTGFILFDRNLACESQIIDLTSSLKDLAGPSVPILIDEEGGRVSRLKSLGPLYITPDISQFEGGEGPETMCAQHYTRISQWLVRLGITVNCAPVMDVRTEKTAPFLQSRCFSTDPLVVKKLSAIAITAMLTQGIIPVMKHLPGHGAATVDSHHTLPHITHWDPRHLIPFQESSAPWGMTSHLFFPSLDKQNCATFSSTIVQNLIRESLGFKGILITDDLCMGAISDIPLHKRIIRALQAGHDCALVCHGTINEWEQTLSALPEQWRPTSVSKG